MYLFACAWVLKVLWPPTTVQKHASKVNCELPSDLICVCVSTNACVSSLSTC